MNITTITKDNFDKEVKEANGPVLVDFWATWCGPCQMQAPVLDEIAEKYDGVKIGKVNVDNEQELAIRYGVSSIPTMILFKDGEEAEKLVGLRSKEELVRMMGL